MQNYASAAELSFRNEQGNNNLQPSQSAPDGFYNRGGEDFDVNEVSPGTQAMML
jgi:hypothetical protein